MTGLCWECQRFSTDDIPRLQDLFRAADENILIDAAFEARRFESSRRPFSNKEARRKMISNMKHAIGQMRNLAIRRTPCTLVFIPSGIYGIGRHGQVLYCIEANLMDMVDLGDIERRSGANPPMQDTEEHGSASPVFTNQDPWAEDRPMTYPFEFIPWKKTLGYGIWMPQDYCQKERYLFLASIFNEMTFLGTDARRSKARQKKVLAGLRKSTPKPIARRIDDHGDRPLPMLLLDYGLGPPDDGYSSCFMDRQARFVDRANREARIEMGKTIVDLGRRCGVLNPSTTTYAGA